MGTKDRNVLLCFGLANLECKTCNQCRKPKIVLSKKKKEAKNNARSNYLVQETNSPLALVVVFFLNFFFEIIALVASC